MDFARKQLEKYGWSNGKGLGKNENGISEALKPKIKRSVTGIGHDPAADFTEHWWSALYNKAASNVEIQEKNGKTKKLKAKEDDFQITNNTYHLKKKHKNNSTEEYSGFFIKTAVLDGVKVENVDEVDSGEEEEVGEKNKKDVFKMTDEELFAACEGRTAHKGARHGLRALGKLARIDRQEQLLLEQPQYNGYSHAEQLKRKRKDKTVETTSVGEVDRKDINDESLVKIKKKKRCKKDESDVIDTELVLNETENANNLHMETNSEQPTKASKKKRCEIDESVMNTEQLLHESDKANSEEPTRPRKKKRDKCNENKTENVFDQVVKSDNEESTEVIKMKKGKADKTKSSNAETENYDEERIEKKKKRDKKGVKMENLYQEDEEVIESANISTAESKLVHKKKKKRKYFLNNSQDQDPVNDKLDTEKAQESKSENQNIDMCSEIMEKVTKSKEKSKHKNVTEDLELDDNVQDKTKKRRKQCYDFAHY